VERFVRDDVGTPLSVVTINGESIVRAPDVESTVDESFASALDQSQPLIRHSILAGRMSDPFSVQPKNAATIESRQKKGSRSLRPELDEMDESLEQDSGSDIDEEVR